MFANFARRTGEQTGSGQPAAIGAVLAVCLLTAAVFALPSGSTAGTEARAGDVAAQRAALTASSAASNLAANARGSYAGVGLLSLHKLSLVPLHPSPGRSWLSAASGTARTYSLTVTAPGGDTYTITRSADRTLSGTCHVTPGRSAGSACQHPDASGDGVW